MTRSRTLLFALILGTLVSAPVALARQAAVPDRAAAPPAAAQAPRAPQATAQTPAPDATRAPRATQPPAAPAPPVPAPSPADVTPAPASSPGSGSSERDVFGDDDDRGGRDTVRIGQDYSLPAGDAVNGAVVIFGNGTIAGHVDDNVVVIMGTARLASTASVGGDVVVIGGSTVIEPGATVRQDLVVIGGGVDTPAGFAPGGQQVAIGSNMFGGPLAALVPWLSRGLLWGRPIVPSLPWVWGIVAFVLIVSIAVNALFDRPVYAAADVLREKPLTAFGAGLLVLLLFVPTVVVLAASVVGLLVVPVAFCALVAAWVVGKVAVARRLGGSIAGDAPEERLLSLRALVIGFALLCVAYMIPVIGLVTWAISGVTGLGAATLMFIATYRRENPAPTAPVPPPVPPPVGLPDTVGAATMAATGFPGAAVLAPANAADVRAGSVPPLPAASALMAFPHAFFRERVAAFALDFILVILAVQLLDVTRGGRAFFTALLLYHVALWTWKQTTVGGIICQLRVVRVDGSPLAFADALVRGLSSIFSLAVLGLGVLWILRDPERQAWHDKIAGTFVVKVPRNFPL